MSPNDQPPSADAFKRNKRNRVVRRPQRGFYDKATVYGILDSALLCHIAYVIDGQPFCTPTSFWREDDRLYWHGSAASRMIRNQAEGLPVCLTVTHMDAIVLARCGFNHSVNYRAVMAFGTAQRIDDPAEKVRLMDRFLERFFPGRAALMRPPSRQEIKATSFMFMDIEDASAKIRDVGVHDEEEDYAVPAWCALLPIKTVLGAVEECPRQLPGVTKPAGMKGYVAGRPLDEVVTETYAAYADTFG